MEEKYMICEDSPEGIFTAIYDAYALREGHEHIHIQVGEEDDRIVRRIWERLKK